MKLKQLAGMALLAAAALLGQKANADIVQITDASLTGTTINWSRTNTYVLNGYCFVKQGQTLNIEAGTIIKGVNGAPGVFGALFVTRGAKIFALGTPHQPIIFTADVDNIGTANPWPNLGITQRGLWGGVVLYGQATLNTPSDASGAAANPKYDVFEGLPDTVISGQNVHRFGGSDDNDNSGVMRYVSIRHGGKILESNKELNGLSICGVGRGTTLEFIESFAIADDGFEFFGGTVNTRYLVSAFNDDDAFDADQGHRGKHQFWLGIQAPDARDKGYELNGEPVGLSTGASPVANFTVYNATSIGAGAGSGGANNNVFTIRDYAAPRFYNCIFTDFAQRGISIDNASLTHLNSGLLDFRENLWFGFTAGNTAANLDVLNAAILFSDTSRNNLIVDPMLRGISRTNNGGLDPRPQAGSPALASSITAPDDGFFKPVAYKGAFDTNDLWFSGWTALSQYGVSAQRSPANLVQITDASLTGANINWYRTNIYVLNGYCFVKAGSTLNIEAGTLIKGKDGAPGVFGALFVTRGAKINALGTPSSPIIFTAEADNIGTANPWPNLGITQRALWGGIVLYGQATLNTPSDASGAAASPKYDVFEGLPDTVINGQNVHRFGGSDDNDNSGVMRYVSIRHGGKVLESNKEINGLSICGVGRGTTLEFIESFAIADDGFEFFGGTVNTRYLVSAFNDDDAFDADQGHRGKHQFWFSIQSPDARDKGFELNGEPVGLSTGASPIANFEVYNATSIGAGIGSGGANNNVFTIRDYAAPSFRNSIFTDYAQRGISIDNASLTHLNSGVLKFENNLWFGFTAGNTAANLDVLNAAVLFNDTSRSNLIVDPLLTSISRSTNGGLDPRPLLASPARGAFAQVLPVDGFLTPVNYVGAFGDQNWAADWTALSDYHVITSAGAATPAAAPQPTAPVVTVQPVGGIANGGGSLTLSAGIAGAGPLTYQWFKSGTPVRGATNATLVLNNLAGERGTNHIGPSTVVPPVMDSLLPGYVFEALFSAGETVNNKADGVTTYRMVGIPDGLGAFDNNDGTFTLLMNHELGNTVGIARTHGGKGAFVSRWVIAKSNLAVLNISDLVTNVFLWNGTSHTQAVNAAFTRFCSADLPAPGAFFNATSGLGSTNRIFMNGEENNKESRALAHVVTGPDAGKSYELPYLGKIAWENALANPFPQNKTIVGCQDDSTVSNSRVNFYIGTKANTGLDIDKAGLTGGTLYGVKLNGFTTETDASVPVNGTAFSLFSYGNVANLTGAQIEALAVANGVASFQRAEDGAWDPANPRDYYFVTTASFTGKSRLWRLRFADIANPENGGFIDLLVTGTEGHKMLDNVGFDADGNLLLQEDPGNQTYVARMWKYVPSTGAFFPVATFRPNPFTSGRPGFLTQDEESSGVIDVSSILGYKASLLVAQIHTTNGIPVGASVSEIVENGQLLLLREVDSGTYSLVVSNAFGAVTSAVANVTITAPPAIGDTAFHNGLPGATVSSGGTLILTVPANAVAGNGPLAYQWFLNNVLIPSATNSTLTVSGFVPGNAGSYSVRISNAAGATTSVPVPVSTADIAFFGGVTIEGPANAKYRLEYLSDVSNTNSWTTLTNIVHAGGKQFYIDTTSSGTQRRFFRAVPTP